MGKSRPGMTGPKPNATMLRGLSLEDRELMLTMMAALASAAQTMMKATSTIQPASHAIEAQDLLRAMDDEANSIIDICKRAKDRLKPGQSVVTH